MAVTVADIALDLRLIAAPDAALPAAQAAIIGRHLATAQNIVTRRAPSAPETLQDGAIIAIASYLYDRPTAASGNRFGAVFQNCGAAAILAGHLTPGARAIGAASGPDATPAGGPGVDNTARAEAEAASAAAATAQRTADTNTGFLSTFVERATAVIQAVVPAWALSPNPPSGGGSGDLPAIPADGETYTLQGRDPAGQAAAFKFWERPNYVPDTPGTAAGVGHALTVTGQNDRDYAFRAVADATARQGIATLTPIVEANRQEIADLMNRAGGAGKLRGVFSPGVAQYHDVSAYLTAQVAGEADLDMALVLEPEAFGIELWRYNNVADPPVWNMQTKWWGERPLAWATRGNGERMPDAKLPAAIPFANMRAKLFDSETDTPVAAGNVTIAFNVNNVPDGETIAMAGGFPITAEQVQEPGRQLRIAYDMTDAARVGLPPTETELILRTTPGGRVLQSLPVHDRHADTLTFDLSGLAAAGNLRWAIIVKTKGRYHGNIQISDVRFHSSDGAADPFIRRVASKLVETVSKALTALTARVAALEAGGGNAIPDAAVGPSNSRLVDGSRNKFLLFSLATGADHTIFLPLDPFGADGDRIWIEAVSNGTATLNFKRLTFTGREPADQLVINGAVVSGGRVVVGNVAGVRVLAAGETGSFTFIRDSAGWKLYSGIWQ